MTDIPISVGADNGDIAQPEDDGRARPLQELIDAWAKTSRRDRRYVLQCLWNTEQRLTARVIDPAARESTRKYLRGGIVPTRTARYLLRGLANALDPRPEPTEPEATPATTDQP